MSSQISSFHTEMSQIASSLKDSWNINRIVIQKDEGDSFYCKAAFNLRQLLPDFLSPFFSEDYRKENRETINYFYKVFGKKRITQIANENSLHIDYKRIHGLALTRSEVEILFVNMGVVTVDTLNQIFEDLKTNPASYLSLTEEQTSSLSGRFCHHNFSDLTKEDFDILYKIASPFDKIETYFLNNTPEINQHYFERWNTFEGQKKMVYILEDIRRNSHSDLGRAQFECEFRKIKKLISWCVKKGLVLPEPEGYRFVYDKIEGGGSYKVLLKALAKTDSFRSQVCYLSTQSWNSAVSYPWESMIEDAKRDIGGYGIKATYQDTKNYLYNPTYGFVNDADEKVDGLGYSLGGAGLALDFCLFEKIQKMIAVNNPAVSSDVAIEFANRLNQSQNLSEKRKITYIWDIDDAIPYGGDEFIGVRCNRDQVEIEVDLIRPIENDSEVSPTIPKRRRAPDSWWETLKQVKNAFFNIHSRETTIRDYRKNTIKNTSDQLQQLLDTEILTNEPYGWEEMRKKIAYFIFGDKPEDRFIRFLEAHSS